MTFISAFRAISGLCYITLALSATYGRTDNISGSSFLSAFSYQAISDPTHGRV